MSGPLSEKVTSRGFKFDGMTQRNAYSLKHIEALDIVSEGLLL